MHKYYNTAHLGQKTSTIDAIGAVLAFVGIYALLALCTIIAQVFTA